MTRTGHHLTGLAAGVFVAGLLDRLWPGMSWWAAIPAAWFGGVAPDRLEYLSHWRWIKHRTLTHWGVFWLALAGWSVWRLHHAAPPGWLDAGLLGFSAGGLSHLLTDWPNPMGVPWLIPNRRHSLNWWTSGRHETEIVAGATGLAWLGWHHFTL